MAVEVDPGGIATAETDIAATGRRRSGDERKRTGSKAGNVKECDAGSCQDLANRRFRPEGPCLACRRCTRVAQAVISHSTAMLESAEVLCRETVGATGRLVSRAMLVSRVIVT